VERTIAVYVPKDVEEAAGSQRVRVGAEPHFAQPLGNETTVGRYWSTPAADLGLLLLAGLQYHGSFRLASPERSASHRG
jgi:hypothetical protein